MSSKPTRAAVAAVSAMLAIVPVGLVSSAASAKDTMADCTKFADGWRAAYNARDANALADMYEPETGTFSSVFWTAKGHEALLQGFKQELSMGNTMTSLKCESSEGIGENFGISTGTWSATAKGPDGKAVTIGGHWESSVTGHRGKYRIVKNLTNMQLPPPR